MKFLRISSYLHPVQWIKNISLGLILKFQEYNLNKKDSFLEIGPGKGSLTELITGCVETLDAVELDRDLILGLRLLAQKEDNLTIHKGDILDFDIVKNLKPKKKLRVLGNLPYNISSSIMLWSFLNFLKQLELTKMKK